MRSNSTNTHLALTPIVEKLAARVGKYSMIVTNEPDDERMFHSSRWALVSSKPITSPAILAAGEKPMTCPNLRGWTDDYNNLFQILK